MAFKTWQIGLEIQQQTLRAVAVQRQRQGWQLRHWWHLPLPESTFREGVLQSPENLMTVLGQWRRELPLRHQLRVAFPTQRTLQRAVPAADNRLQETARESYLVAAAARQLQMQPAQLSWDYTPMPQDACQLFVTAARQSEVKGLLGCLNKQRLFPVTLTPGASVLPALSHLVDSDEPFFLVHREYDSWLWATSGAVSTWAGSTAVRRRRFQNSASSCQPIHSRSPSAARWLSLCLKGRNSWMLFVRSCGCNRLCRSNAGSLRSLSPWPLEE